MQQALQRWQSRRRYKRDSGFTIVELLIVIVVIAILALIVVTTYNGVQAKARNTTRVSAAKDWQQILTSYVTVHGEYPTVVVGSGQTGICLGTDYPDDWDADGQGDCYSTANIKHPNSTWNNDLSEITSTFPHFDTTAVDTGGGTLYRGIVVRSTSTPIDGVAYWPFLFYWLDGTDQRCVVSPVVSSSGSTSDGAINSGNVGQATQCKIKLPDPAGL